MQEYPEYLVEGNGMKFLSDDGGETYNRCHCELYSGRDSFHIMGCGLKQNDF